MYSQLSRNVAMEIFLEPIGGVLYWIASIYDGEQTISSAIFNWKTCRVCPLFVLIT